MDDYLAEWSTNSNNAIQVSLVIPDKGGPKAIHTFKPKMTAPLFGEDEIISGYQGLRINLRFHACDMRPGLKISFSKRMKPDSEYSPTDLKEIFENYLPRSSFEKSTVFDSAIQDQSFSNWKPPGELWKTIQSGNRTFEVWKGNLADLTIQQMLKRIQILVSFFIEGGTPIELKDPEWSLQRWTVFFLYQKQAFESNISPYVFMGYSTVYQYFFVQAKKKGPLSKSHDITLPLPAIHFSSLPCRSRISQFIVLPPFQGKGNGSIFYNAIYDYYLKESRTIEITVEDPNEAFDDLRDLNDLARLRMIPEFMKLKLNKSAVITRTARVPGDIIDPTELEDIRKTVKIAPRQFSRLVEMQFLSGLPEDVRSDTKMGNFSKSESLEDKDKKHEYRLWKLLVKARLFHHNRDTLIQLDFLERIEKLDQTLWNVERDYERLLKAFETRSNPKVVESSSNSKNPKRLGSTEPADGEPIVKRAKIL
ncbi:putative histone acetyltransferase type b catalytic subunit protein [Erysiphe necator]|uniref:Histone acetyltransferase type B catalytic subunit n=1 Tax=Uncinula necator TaxID=52586 RepID=A0A0B1P1E5_UNCNE|nr:putative histone acetyltransferase type b catalytic subunit protein [Erysiphe necator]